MAQRGLHIRQMAKDGNCLFRCVSDRVYGDADMHDVARRLCMDHMEKERDHFSQYVTQDFDAYISRKRRDGTFGNHIEMQALSEIFSRPIEVYARSEQPINTFQSSEGASSDVPPLRLSYHGRNHYNVLVDPDSPDVGVGLGLPGLQPGEADASQMRDATHASEQEAIERDLLLAAQDRSELDATQEAIEEAVMSASRAEWASHPAAAAGWYADYASGPGKFGKPEAPSWGGRAGGSDDDIPDMAAIGDGADDLDVSQPVANETVQQLLAMGFPLARALHAHEMFGDLENMLAFLTNN